MVKMKMDTRMWRKMADELFLDAEQLRNSTRYGKDGKEHTEEICWESNT